jgi:hypothetical protein
LFRRVFVLAAALLLLSGSRAYASSITLLVGDKDGFGVGLAPGAELPCVAPTTPCLSPIQDWRTLEIGATNGAQLTDVYSALYDGTELDCGTGFQACSPNGATGVVVFTFTGTLTSASITMRMGDFESTKFGAMTASINGVPISFFYEHGYRQTAIETIVLTPEMLAAANLVGEVRLFLDHRVVPGQVGPGAGSFDYIAFDYFELNAEAIPEPGTWLLLGTGLALVARRVTASRRTRSR